MGEDRKAAVAVKQPLMGTLILVSTTYQIRGKGRDARPVENVNKDIN